MARRTLAADLPSTPMSAPSFRQLARARCLLLLAGLLVATAVEAQPIQASDRVRVTFSDTTVAHALGIRSALTDSLQLTARVHEVLADSLVLRVADGRRYGVPQSALSAVEVSHGRSPWRHLGGIGGALAGAFTGALIGGAIAPETEGPCLFSSNTSCFQSLEWAGRGLFAGGVVGTFVGAHVGRRLAPERWRPVDGAPTAERAPADPPAGERHWAVRSTFSVPAAGSASIEAYLSDQGFDDDRPRYGWFGGEILGYSPRPIDQSEPITQTLTVVRQVRPNLRLGVRGVLASRSEAEGYHQDAGDLRVAQAMAAVLPVAEWSRGPLRVGAGAGVAWGKAGEIDYAVDPDDRAGSPDIVPVFLDSRSYLRPAATAYVGAGGTLFGGRLSLGVEAQWVYAGTVDIGPFAEGTAGPGSIRADDVSVGPVVGVRW